MFQAMFQSPILILVFTNLITIAGIFYTNHDKNSTITQMQSKIDLAISEKEKEELKVKLCESKIDSQNQGILLLEQFGTKQQEFIDDALDKLTKQQKASEIKITKILQQKIPKDCRGALDHLKSVSTELSEW